MDSEVKEILECIENKQHFVLHGGAGSGKTHSLMELLNYLYSNTPKIRIVCITFTNVAVNEIRDRTPFETLQAYTIHDFLWNIIKEFQFNIKKSIIELIKQKIIIVDSNNINVELLEKDYNAGLFNIEYKEWRNISKGIISHDEIPLIAEHMFKSYPLLCKIISDKLDYVFVDEYQDTDIAVINILIEHINKDNQLLLGFFGDKMQSIYGNNSIDISSYIEKGTIKEIVKKENRRNPQTVINAMNLVRKPFDELKQEAADDSNAPNYGKKGIIKFLYSQEHIDIEQLKLSEYFNDWDFSNSKDAKELYLTYRLIGPIAGFQQLLDIYSNDKIISLKDRVRKHIKNNNLKEPDSNKSFGAVLKDYKINPTPAMQTFIDNNLELFEEAKQVDYSKMKKIYIDRGQLTGNVKSHSNEDTRNRQDPRNALSKHLCKLQYYIELFKGRQYNDLINLIDLKIDYVADKIRISNHFEKLLTMYDSTISEVVEYAHKNRICIKDDNFNRFVDEYAYIYNRVKKVCYKEVINLYKYIEGFTIYSTQHNIKGAEFDKVFVVLDNGDWNQYNFKYLFENTGNDSVIIRTRKIFYVCCTRTKEELIIYYSEPSANVLKQAQEWFGENSVIEITL